MAKDFGQNNLGMLEINDLDAVVQHLHLTISRQRVLLRLSPRCQQGLWGNAQLTAARYLITYQLKPAALQLERDDAAEDVGDGDGGPVPPDPVATAPEASLRSDAQVKLDHDILQHGSPDYRRCWVEESEVTACVSVQQGNVTWYSKGKACGDVHACLFCASKARKEEDATYNWVDEEAVAALDLPPHGQMEEAQQYVHFHLHQGGS